MELKYNTKILSIDNKVLTELDKFVINFTDILKKYCDYVIISGYIPILFGRTRGTEDVYVFIDHIDKKKFVNF